MSTHLIKGKQVVFPVKHVESPLSLSGVEKKKLLIWLNVPHVVPLIHPGGQQVPQKPIGGANYLKEFYF